MKRIIFILLFTLAAVAAIFGVRLSRQPYREYVAPQGYIGQLTVVVDPASPIAIDTTELLRYHYVIRFPSDGVLRVKNAWGVHPMAHEEWKYPDGTLLRATNTGPYPGRVEILNGGGPHTKPGAEYRWEILPVGKTASR